MTYKPKIERMNKIDEVFVITSIRGGTTNRGRQELRHCCKVKTLMSLAHVRFIFNFLLFKLNKSKG